MTSKKILITGSTGFFGRYMAEYINCLDAGHDIIGIDNRENKICGKFYNVDISEGTAVSDVIAEVLPDVMIHLAGTFGMDDNQQIYRTNVMSIIKLLEAVVNIDPQCVVVAAGSAAEYGRIDAKRMPADESVPCMPVTPYGLSKWLATQTALYYHRVHNLNVSIVRPFQLIGNGVTNKLAPGAFFEQIVNACKSGNKIIKVGNLKSSRDFLDVRDAARAVWMLCEKPAAGEIFNLCSGSPTKIGDLLKLMIDAIGIDVKIEVDPNRLKGSADVSEVYGSYSKISKHCGWIPEIDIEKSIRIMFNG